MYTKICFVPALLAAVLAASVAQADDKPVATVNGVQIPQTEMDYILHAQEAKGAKDSPELRGKIRDFLVDQEIVTQEAQKQGLDKTADFHMELKFSRATVLQHALIDSYLKSHPISEADMKAEFAKRIKAMGDQKEYHARHILVKTEAEANAVLAALKKGKSFATLAKEKSIDVGSKDNGGDLGWSDPHKFVPAFGQALEKLSKGQITQTPVKTQYGYHIIKLVDVRTEPKPTFDQVKAQFANALEQQQVEAYINDLKAKAKVD